MKTPNTPRAGLASILLFANLFAGAGIGQAEVSASPVDPKDKSQAAPLTIDLTREVRAPSPSPYGPGTSVNPSGETITADSRSFFLNGKPWVPISGEFHYSRYPRAEWRDALLKMKAGGINTVATYVFWNHHEEERGKFDWSGQRSLRDFLTLCKEVGLKVIVRMGPWAHGEVRNGGFPDWVQNSGTRLKSKDPAYLKLVEPYFKEQAKQMAGLLWKDGGPVIGVQMDNECADPDYLLELKRMARADGVDVPIYTMTGWNGVPIPKEGLFPLFGAYSIGFWGGKLEEYRKCFVFTDIRDWGDMGAQFQRINTQRSEIIEQFPFACAEIGTGMVSNYAPPGYGIRVKVYPDEIGAMAWVKLGCGNNMPGYYMYQGGLNPDGKLSSLSDEKHHLPFKDYDFQAALGSAGQVREQYHLLREQHLFLEDFGPALARMPSYFPDQQSSDLNDFSVLRWAVRSDGDAGFLFFSNHQPTVPLPEHKDVQFRVKTKSGTLLIPQDPITIPAASYGMWPVNLDCNGVKLVYATAQPICRINDDGGNPFYFFTALAGIEPEFLLQGEEKDITVKSGQKVAGNGEVRIRQIQPGPGAAVVVTKPAGGTVTFVVLTREQGKALWRASFAGRERGILSNATVLADGNKLRLQIHGKDSLAIFPPLPAVKIAGSQVTGSPEGVFSRFPLPALPAPPVVTLTQISPAAPDIVPLQGMKTETWDKAAVYKLNIPAAAANRHLLLNVHYIGDAARLYLGDKLLDDHFYNGDPMPVALWRVPSDQWSELRLKILPYTDDLENRLPEEAKRKNVELTSRRGWDQLASRMTEEGKRKFAEAKAASALDKITVTTDEQVEVEVSQ